MQFGTPAEDGLFGLATDASGNLFVGGTTSGDFAAPNMQGTYDMTVSKFSPEGSLLWKRQIGSEDSDYARSVTTDANGNVIILGDASGLAPNEDYMVVAKFSPDGELLWQHLNRPDGDLRARRVATDASGNVFVTGMWRPASDTEDPNSSARLVRPLLAKYSASGELLWSQEPGVGDGAADIAIDPNDNLFVVGEFFATDISDDTALPALEPGDTRGALVKYSDAGELLWSQQLVGQDDSASCVATDGAGNAFVGGELYGAPAGAGHLDVFLAKLDGQGQELWRRLFGTAQPDLVVDVATATDGAAFVASATQSERSIASPGDFVVRKYSPDGDELWSERFGSYWKDSLDCLAADPAGSLFAGGTTDRNLVLEDVSDGDLNQWNLGQGDAFILKFP